MIAGLSLSNQVAFQRISNGAAAGQTAVTSSAVTRDNFEVLTFLVSMGDITTGGVQSAKIQQSSDDGSTDAYSDLEGSNVAIADTNDNKDFLIEIVKPTKRYLKLVVSRATQDSVVNPLYCLKSHPRVIPVTQPSNVVTSESHVSPAEGTA